MTMGPVKASNGERPAVNQSARPTSSVAATVQTSTGTRRAGHRRFVSSHVPSVLECAVSTWAEAMGRVAGPVRRSSAARYAFTVLIGALGGGCWGHGSTPQSERTSGSAARASPAAAVAIQGRRQTPARRARGLLSIINDAVQTDTPLNRRGVSQLSLVVRRHTSCRDRCHNESRHPNVDGTISGRRDNHVETPRFDSRRSTHNNPLRRAVGVPPSSDRSRGGHDSACTAHGDAERCFDGICR